ncbi:cadherin-like domain-containing protein, partial [Vibrio sp. 1-Bac 57]
MEKQNNLVDDTNDTEVVLNEQQVTEAEQQLKAGEEQLIATEDQLVPTATDDAVSEVDAEEEIVSDIENIDDLEALLALGEEVFDLDIETAAGELSNGGSSSVVDFARDGAETIATTAFQTSAFNTPTIDTQVFTDENDDDANFNVNSAATLTLTNTNNFIEDDGSAVIGAVVSTYTINDLDGDQVTVTLSDTENYALDGNGNVVLTETGAALVNNGQDLPPYTLTPNDGQVDGQPVSHDPSITTTNDAPILTLTSTTDFTEDDGSAVEGAVVATFETSDEDGDDVTVILNDTINYALDDNGNVVLTEAGAALVNSGQVLPPFTLTPTDGQDNGETVSVEPGITAANDAPTIDITSVTNVTEDAAETVAGLVVATFETNDEDSDSVTVVLSDTVNYAIVDGTVVLTAVGAALANSGEELPEFTLTPSDDDVSGEPASVDPSVELMNDLTFVNNDTGILNEDAAIDIDVLANDDDSADGSDAAVSPVESVTQGANGSVSINADGTVKYTPNADFNGSDSFTYTNEEGQEATVNVTVDAVNDLTVVTNDTATTNEDAAIDIDVLANDTDTVDGTAAAISPVASVTQGSNGSVVVNADGTVKYTPNADFNGTDSFTYTNEEGQEATVNVTVDAVNDLTVVANDTATTNEDAAIDIDVLANDDDSTDGTEAAISPVESVTQGTNGIVTINADGTVKYTPNADFNGTDSFTYTNEEGQEATVNVTVDAVNDLTVVANDTASTNEDAAIDIDVLANDDDSTDGSEAAISPVESVTQGTNGIVTIN